MNPKNQYFILDIGTSLTRIGYGGEEKPKSVLPSYVGSSINAMEEEGGIKTAIVGENINDPSSDINILKIYDSGKVVDFDALQTFLNTIISTQLQTRPEQTTIILTQDNLTERTQRQKLCNIIFEKLNFRSVLFSKVATLAAYSAGRTTGIILDSGEALTTSTLVHDGFAFGKSGKRSEYAGRTLTNQVRKYVQQSLRVKVTSIAELKSNNLSSSSSEYHKNQLYKNIKETIFGQGDSKGDLKEYTLPDKQTIKLSKKQIPSIFFGKYNNNIKYQGVSSMVNQTINETELEIKLKLYENIVVVGGNSYVDKFVDNLQKGLRTMVPPEARLKVVASTRRKEANWLGASILSSISSLQPFCVNKKDFSEFGASILDKKCP